MGNFPDVSHLPHGARVFREVGGKLVIEVELSLETKELNASAKEILEQLASDLLQDFDSFEITYTKVHIDKVIS